MTNHAEVPMLLKKFTDGLTKAVGGSQQMVHHHQKPQFIPIYQKLSLIRDKTIRIAMNATGVEVRHGRPR